MSPAFVTPENPGTVLTFSGDDTVRPAASIAETVALLITHDWGPVREPTLVSSFAEFEAVFGDSDTDGRDAVLSAFAGPGVPELAGAGSVIVYRMGLSAGGSSAAAATITLSTATPTASLRLTARYTGTRGNRLTAVVEADPSAPTTRHRLRILLDDVTVEKFSYDKTDIAGLAAVINARPSKYVEATELATGTALSLTAGTALAGGRDGTPVTVTEYSAAADALEFQPFSVLAPANLPGGAIEATLVSWVQGQADAMRPVELVLGGASGETLDDAILRTDGLRDPHVVSLGAGTLHDDFLDKDIGTAKVAPRVAGALAGIGQGRALTYLPLAGLSLVDPVEVTTDRLREAADNGVTVFRRSSRPDAGLIISRGVSTFTEADNAAYPLAVFSEPRFVRILDLLLRRIKDWGDVEIIGLPNSAETRAAVQEKGLAELSALYNEGLILNTADRPYYFNVLEPDPDSPDLIPFEFGLKFVDTTNYLVGTGKVSV